MATIYWKSTDDAWREGEPQDGPVNEQHPVPLQLMWREEGDGEWHPVDGAHPFPMALTETVKSGLWISPLKEVPGIAAADALDANDALGSLFVFDYDMDGTPLPVRGFIVAAKLVDPDDDTLAATLHIFHSRVAVAASDAAFSISTADARQWVTSIQFSTTTDIGGAKVAEQTGWNSPYYSSDRQLYCQLSTTGTPNIAAGRMPQVQLFVIPAQGAV